MSAFASDDPGVTDHARERLVDRASRYVTSVSAAWQRARGVAIPSEAPVPHHDEARWDRGSDTVLFRRGEELTTAYGLTSEHVTTIQGVAVAVVVDAQHGTDYCSGIDPTNLEEVR